MTVIVVDENGAVTGEFNATDAGSSYLADSVVFRRHLALNGRLRKAIGALTMRASDFEQTLREFRITANGISVGDPLDGLTGILTGEPRMTTPTEYDDE